MKLKRIILSDLTFLIIMILLGIISIFSFQRITNLSRQSNKVNHSNRVKLELEETLSLIMDAETRQRFFLLTKDQSYLLSPVTTLRINREHLRQLDSLTKDNVEQQADLRRLDTFTRERYDRLNGVVTTARNGKPDLQSMLYEGKEVMDSIRAVIARMNNIESSLLSDRSNDKYYADKITPLSSLILSVFSIFIISLSYYILRNETRLRFRVQDDVKKLSDYFKDLPALFAVLKGPTHIHEFGNTRYHLLTGNRELAGKPFRDSFPELEGQGIFELMDKVYQTGQPFTGTEMPIAGNLHGRPQTRYFNFIFQPVFNNKKQREGILIFGYEITEMMEARKKVEYAEQKLRLAIEAANIGTFDWDMEKNRFDWSARFLEIFGYDRPVSRQNLLEMFHPADKPIRDKAVEESFARGTLTYDARIIWPDKSIRWVSVHGKITYNKKQEAIRMSGTAIDITEQKNILEDLTESEAKFRLLADSMPQIVWTTDVEGKLDYFNQAFYNYSGLTMADIERDGWISIIHPEDREENIRKWSKAVSSGEEFLLEHRFRNIKGEYRWQFSRAIPQKDEHGDIQRWVGTSSDIQDQKNYAQKLEGEISDRTVELSEVNKNLLIKNNIFSQAEENALIGSYSWNLHTQELEYSDNLFRLFGFEPNEFVPSFEHYFTLIHPEDKEQVMKDGMATLQDKRLSANTYRIITKAGQIKYFRSTGKIMGEGENIMLIGTVQDISQDTRLNEILRIKNLELERSNAELESFNYIASHDLQEPLRKIQAFSQRILQKEATNFSPFSKDYFDRINSSAARMQDLINALLNYSRADSSINDSALVDLNVILDNVKTDLQDMLEEKNARVENTHLPLIKAVGIQVHQLFTNLVSNAVKYSRPGVAPVVQVTAEKVSGNEIKDAAADKKKNYHKITVSDNGIGFEQEYETKIFELFQRLHSNENYKGTGIGLAICKKIMRNHQGFVSAIGHPGIGSSFSVYFPDTLLNLDTADSK